MTPNFKVSHANYSVFKFPSGELQVTLDSSNFHHTMRISGSILSSDHLMELLQLVEVLYHTYTTLYLEIVLPYCAYSRQDRRCNRGEAFSLKVFANLINSCNFTKVITYDNHSDVSTALINNCHNLPVKHLLLDRRRELNLQQYSYFVSPDAGSNKKVFECAKLLHKPIIRADKLRDTSTGAIIDTQVFATSEQLKSSTILIIDDICQGGRTFEELAKAIKAIEPTCEIHLYVTHGFFNAGFDKMQEAGISKFYTTDSVPQVHTCSELAVLP